MKKLLFVFTLSSLFVCCNNGKETPSGGEVDLKKNLIPGSFAPDSTLPWKNTLRDTTSIKEYVSKLTDFFNGKNVGIPTTSFVVNADALFHAITDSAHITDVIFYLGMNATSDTLKLMYLPARKVNDSVYNEILPLNSVLDQSVPCPTCKFTGPIPLTKDK